MSLAVLPHRHWDPGGASEIMDKLTFVSRGGENISKALTAPSVDRVRPETNRHGAGAPVLKPQNAFLFLVRKCQFSIGC